MQKLKTQLLASLVFLMLSGSIFATSTAATAAPAAPRCPAAMVIKGMKLTVTPAALNFGHDGVVRAALTKEPYAFRGHNWTAAVFGYVPTGWHIGDPYKAQDDLAKAHGPLHATAVQHAGWWLCRYAIDDKTQAAALAPIAGETSTTITVGMLAELLRKK